MKRTLICLIFLVGCGNNPINNDDNIAPLTPEAKKKIEIDPKLLEKCPAFTKQLDLSKAKDGIVDEAEIVVFVQKALQNAKDCREHDWRLVDWVKKTFGQ